jgi:hypothetical protein
VAKADFTNSLYRSPLLHPPRGKLNYNNAMNNDDLRGVVFLEGEGKRYY